MKFSASLVDEGIRVLERSFLPACSKTGKKILLLISEDHIYLVQDTHESKGMHVVAMIETVRAALLGFWNENRCMEL